MKSVGKARNNGLYRHIRTSKEIIRNLLNDYAKNTKTYYKTVYSPPSLVKSTAIESLSKATSSFISSRNARARYRRNASGGGYYYERLKRRWIYRYKLLSLFCAGYWHFLVFGWNFPILSSISLIKTPLKNVRRAWLLKSGFFTPDTVRKFLRFYCSCISSL